MVRPVHFYLRNVLFGVAFLANTVIHAQITWRRSFGGFDSDRAACVRQTQDGGYIVVGSTGSFGQGSGDIYAVRLDELGAPLWSRAYGGIGVDIGVSCRELADGFVFAGTTTTGSYGGYDMVLTRTDLNGVVLWQRTFGSASWDLCNSMETLSDGYVLAGISYGGDTPLGAQYIVRTDLLGDTLWTRKIPSDRSSECRGISLSADGGFLLAGSVGTDEGSSDGCVTKLNSAGDEVWVSFFGGDSADYLISVVEAPSGNIVACGGTHSQNPFLQVYIVGMGPGGEAQWEQFIGSNSDAAGTEIRNRPNGGYVFTGYNTLNLGNRDIILTTIDEFGQFEIGNNFGDGEPADGYSVDPTDDGGYVVAGWCENYGPGIRSVYVVKTDSNAQTSTLVVEPFFDPLGITEPLQGSNTYFSPNPASAGDYIQFNPTTNEATDCSFMDLAGRVLGVVALVPGSSNMQVPPVPPGMYIFQLRDGRRILQNARLVVR